MPYIDTQYLFKCETCRHCVGDIKCNTFCDSGECYSPNMYKIPTADVAPRAEVVNKICCEIEEEIVAALESNYQALKGWDDGRCNDYILEIVNRIKGKIDALRGIEGFVEELKKKYTDATDTNVGHKTEGD